MYKFGRILSSTIRATNVVRVKRSAQFNPAFDPSQIGFADELPEEADESQSSEESADRAADSKDPLSRLGLRAAPATGNEVRAAACVFLGALFVVRKSIWLG